MSDEYLRYRCRICNGAVTIDHAWIDIDAIGRFWLCPEHWGNDDTSLFFDDRTGEISLVTQIGTWRLWPFDAPVVKLSDGPL